MFICQPYKKMEGKIDKFKSEIDELRLSSFKKPRTSLLYILIQTPSVKRKPILFE